jgi:hypothetical protein
LADAVCLNDPITGQGSNNASKAAKIYLDAIVAHGDRPFDEAFMQATFDPLELCTVRGRLTNALLQPPPPCLKSWRRQTYRALARRVANGFDNPLDLFPWFAEPEEADRPGKSAYENRTRISAGALIAMRPHFRQLQPRRSQSMPARP